MILYAIRYTRDATAAIYQIERGAAGEVTLAIKTLSIEPKPYYSFETDIPNTYAFNVHDTFVTYQIFHDERVIKILLIEKDNR